MTEIFRDENGKISSTRLILLAFTVIFALLSLSDLYLDVEVHGQIYNIILAVFSVGLGGNSISRTATNWRNNND